VTKHTFFNSTYQWNTFCSSCNGMRSLIAVVFLLIGSANLFAQQRTLPDSVYRDSIRDIEYQLEGLSHRIINGPDLNERITSTYYFVQTLKKALKIPTSYSYDFDLLKTVSVLRAPDDKFRIFTWNLLLDSGRYKYFGAIQMNNDDSLVLFGLYDSADHLKDPLFETVDERHWVGALYYQIHKYKHRGKERYILFGWDGEDEFSNKKVIDVLWFNDQGRPRFGDPIFEVGDEYQYRMIFEFNEQAVMLCRYEEKDKTIVYANLVPLNPMYKDDYRYYVPEGTYDYLRLQKGLWVKYELFYERKKRSRDDKPSRRGYPKPPR
jgi:hypothetical protein